jgi:tetratricopeptide (TPR) repeat protein
MDRIERKKIKQDEFVSEGMRIFQWVEDHPTQLLVGAGVFVALVVAAWAGSAWMRSRDQRAADLLARGQAALDAPVVQTGAKPDDPYAPSFASATDRSRAATERLATAAAAGGKPAAVAAYLEGVALLDKGDPNGAIATLEKASAALKGDGTVGPLARAVLASAYDRAGQREKALAAWRQLGEKDSGYPRDMALLGLARTLEGAGLKDEATKTWREIVDAYPDSPVRELATAALGRLGV